MVEWQVNQCSEDHVCPCYRETQFPDSRDRDGPQNVGLLTIQPPNTAFSPRMCYRIQSPWQL